MTDTADTIARLRAAVAAPGLTPGPWTWWTSCSFRRLSSDATGKDGDVLYGAVQQADNHGDIRATQATMEFIAAANPSAIQPLLALLDAQAVELSEASSQAEYWKQIAVSCKPYVEEMQGQGSMGYGFYRPENPNDFTPDADLCTEEEIANHRAACEAYDAGNYTPDKSGGWVTPNMHILTAPWGIGSYVIRDERAEEILSAISRAALTKEAK
jgi:hypothetical protein